MVSYYREHEGNLHPGDIAKAEDINQIQQNVGDAIRNLLEDLNEREGCIIGQKENAFILTPETKRAGRFVDQINLAEDSDAKFISIRETDYRQPIKLSHSSVYSVIVKMQNLSEQDVSVIFELHDDNENLIEGKKTTLNLPKNTSPTEYEIVFDLDYWPTAHGLTHEDLEINDPRLPIPPNNSASETEGVDRGDEQDMAYSSLGASQVYLVVRALNKNKFNINQIENGYAWNDEDPTFGILMNINSNYGQLLEENVGSGFVPASIPGDLYFREVYTNSQSYHCEYGEAMIGGEKVCLADTHVSIEGASSYGNVLSYVYMDIHGHLKAKNSDPYIGAEPVIPIIDEPHLHIANIYTYADSSKDPLIIQDDTNQITRLRSHHERIRRLEKQMKYTQDIAIPPRLKYTLSGDSWIDTNPGDLLYSDKFNTTAADTLDALKQSGYIVTTDANGNLIVKVTNAESFNIPITLKSTTSGVVTTKNNVKVLKSAQTSSYINALGIDSIERAQTFAEIKDMKIDISNGVMTLDSNNSDTNIVVATTAKEAKQTEFNPWDDSAKNRPKSSNIKPTTRAYTVKSGRNGKNDWASEFPAMTFYTPTNYKLTKLEIPVYKFKNCSGVKFLIYKRQLTNNKENTVWLGQRMHVTDVYSLKKAKVKGGYQYVDEGFLINFGKKGLTLPKGQYVIIVLPIVKSGQGTVYVDTYKPADSKDFCIRYYGAANASHFLLKKKYFEVWYNSAKATGKPISYNSTGSVTSGTITWSNKEPIKTIKPTANITIPKNTSCKLEVDVGAGWQEIEIGKANSIASGKNSFRWRITFSGNKKDTPTLKYDKDKKYAINFEIIRKEPGAGNMAEAISLDKNLCLTSKPFDGNKILREYLGDTDFAIDDNKFSNYEFSRIWVNDSTQEDLRIDLSGCDRVQEVREAGTNNIKGYYPIYSLHYVDLKTKDFNSGSVDYSNYDPQMEIDEHNMRLKLDTDYSYNDDEIKLFNINKFDINSQYALDEGIGIDFSKVSVPEESGNITLMKASFDETINIAQYDAIKVGLSIQGEVNGTLSGLALYVSSTHEEQTPSNKTNEPNDNIVIIDTLPDLNQSQEETIAMYGNKIVKRYEPRNGTAGYVYYQSVWDSAHQLWKWELINNIKSYDIYEIVDRSTKQNTLTVTEENNDQKRYYEIYIDPNKINLQYAKEIGLILLADEGKYKATDISNIKLHEFVTIQKDYYPIFDPKIGDKFTMKTSSLDTISKSNASGSITTINKTTPETSQIIIGYHNINVNGQTIAEFDATSKNTKNYNHIGIQLASDCLLVKDMLELHLIQIDEETNVETVIDKIRLPTNNYMYYATTAEGNIKLIQIFKKLETTERFDKIALVTTPKFVDYATKLRTIKQTVNDVETDVEVNGIDDNKSISLFVGKISLYQARTIPMFHPKMRMKFYFDRATQINRDSLGIRKVGVVADYQ